MARLEHVLGNTDCLFLKGNCIPVCSADRILSGPGKIQVWGREFQAVSLPGHAAWQMGYITPDGAVYLGDCLLGPDEVHRQKLVYMLNWRTALETMKETEVFAGRPCMLSHYGVYRDIKNVVEVNIRAFEEALGVVRGLAAAEFSLDEMVKKTVGSMGITVKSLLKTRLMERVIRSMVEYMTETGELRIRIRDGLIVYILP